MPPHHPHIALRLWGIGSLLALAATAFLLIPYVLDRCYQDIPPPDLGVLTQGIAAHMAPTENARALLLQLAPIPDAIVRRIDNHLNGTEWDSLFVHATISRYAHSIDLFRTATQKPYYQDPTLVGLIQPAIPRPEEAVDLTDHLTTYPKLLAVRALMHSRNGQTDAALDDAEIPIRLGMRIQIGNALETETLLAQSMVELGQTMIGRIAAATKHLPLSTLRDIIFLCDRTMPQRKSLARAIGRRELLVAQWFADQVAAGAMPLFPKLLQRTYGYHRYFYQPNRTAFLALQKAHNTTIFLQYPCAAHRLQDRTLPGQDLFALLYAPNAIGHLLLTPATNDWAPYHKILCGHEQRLDAIKSVLWPRYHRMLFVEDPQLRAAQIFLAMQNYMLEFKDQIPAGIAALDLQYFVARHSLRAPGSTRREQSLHRHDATAGGAAWLARRAPDG